MKKTIFLILIFQIMSFSAQEKTKNFGFGVSPFGLGTLRSFYLDTHTDADKKDKQLYKLNLNNYYNAHAFMEKILKGNSFLMEFKYSKSNIFKFESDSAVYILNESEVIENSINSFNFSLYYGYTINKNKRLQIPIYIGGGISYFSSNIIGQKLRYKPFSNEITSTPNRISDLVWQFTTKVRIKFYVTNKIAIYSGINYDTGIFGETENISPRGRIKFFNIDSGIVFNF